MGLFRGLLLGAAAAVVSSSAMAADLPSRKAAPVAYVKICDVYGRAFYYIPGTNTCLRVGGRVRVEYGYYAAKNYSLNGGAVRPGRRLDTLGWRARAYVNMDARTQTAWGTVQAVFSVAFRSRSGTFNGGAFPVGGGGRNTASMQTYAAYIRFAGFTFGRARDIHGFMPPFTYNTTYNAGGAIGSLQLAYTATFGGGFSATIGLVDEDDFGSMNAANIYAGPARTYPNRLPVVVGNIRVDQGWGSAMLTAGVGQWRGVDAVGAAGTIKKTGYMIGGGLRINLPMLARGDRLDMGVWYATGGMIDFAFSGGSLNGSIPKDGRVAFGYTQTINGVSVGACGAAFCASNNSLWSAAILLTHYWSPSLRSHLGASYLNYRASGLQRAAVAGTGIAAGGTAWEVTHTLVWTPTRGFDIGLELQYRRVNNNFVGVIPAGSPALLVDRNPSIFVGKVRVQKTW